MNLSIIITCYNNCQTINEAIESVKNITFKDWECIIINDGSTDNSEEIILESIEGDERFKLITTQNNGVANARNLGLKLASNQWCLLLDGDDLLMKNYPKKAMNALSKNNESIIYFGGVKCSGMLNTTFHSKWEGYEKMLTRPCIFISAIFKREIALNINGFNPNLEAMEDYDFWIRYLHHNHQDKSIINDPMEIMIEYRTHRDSRHFSQGNMKIMKILDEIKKLNKEIYEEYQIKT